MTTVHPLISVIVPVYNVEAYLKRCVDSICGQTYDNLEILLIDDGSTDRSGVICDEISAREGRIRVWHTGNQGPSAARNLGIEQARGEYLLFVDSDDILSLDHIAFLYERLSAEQADLSICNYVTTEQDTFSETEEHDRYVWSGEQALKYLLYQKYFTTGPVCKLYRRGLFTEVRFPEGTLYEDTMAIAQVVGKARNVVYSDAVKYGYFQRPSSTMRSSYNEETFQYVEITKQLMDYVRERYPELLPAAISRFVWANLFVWIKMPVSRESEKKKIVEKNIRRYRGQVLRDPEARYQNKGVLLLSYLGQGVLQKVYQWKR